MPRVESYPLVHEVESRGYGSATLYAYPKAKLEVNVSLFFCMLVTPFQMKKKKKQKGNTQVSQNKPNKK